jgi:hypothetical protein
MGIKMAVKKSRPVARKRRQYRRPVLVLRKCCKRWTLLVSSRWLEESKGGKKTNLSFCTINRHPFIHELTTTNIGNEQTLDGRDDSIPTKMSIDHCNLSLRVELVESVGEVDIGKTFFGDVVHVLDGVRGEAKHVLDEVADLDGAQKEKTEQVEVPDTAESRGDHLGIDLDDGVEDDYGDDCERRGGA